MHRNQLTADPHRWKIKEVTRTWPSFNIYDWYIPTATNVYKYTGYLRNDGTSGRVVILQQKDKWDASKLTNSTRAPDAYSSSFLSKNEVLNEKMLFRSDFDDTLHVRVLSMFAIASRWKWPFLATNPNGYNNLLNVFTDKLHSIAEFHETWC